MSACQRACPRLAPRVCLHVSLVSVIACLCVLILCNCLSARAASCVHRPQRPRRGSPRCDRAEGGRWRQRARSMLLMLLPLGRLAPRPISARRAAAAAEPACECRQSLRSGVIHPTVFCGRRDETDRRWPMVSHALPRRCRRPWSRSWLPRATGSRLMPLSVLCISRHHLTERC